MNINQFENLINKRIDLELEAARERELSERLTIRYLYKTILSEIKVELQNSINSFNKVLENYNDKYHYWLYFGDRFERDDVQRNNLMIIIKDKNSEHPNSQTLKTNYNHCIIGFERVNGIENNYEFLFDYFIHTTHGYYDKKNLKLKVNEDDSELIKSQILNFFNLFIEASIEKISEIKFVRK
jgi:hypothetical protein